LIFINVYNDILDKVPKKLVSWKGNMLNKVGRASLVKTCYYGYPSIYNATPSYRY